MRQVLTLLRIADTVVVKVTRFGVILGMLMLFILLMIRIVARATEIPFVAFDEIGELATVWMILFGIVAMWRGGTLYSVDFHYHASNRAALLLNLLVQVVMLAFAVVLVWQGGKFTMMNRESSAFLLINMDYYYGAIPAAAAVMSLYSLQAVWQRLLAVVAGRAPDNYFGDSNSNIPSGHL